MAHRVFVTGATDFVGGYLVWKLRERGDEVRCLVSSPDEAGVLSKIGAKLVTGKVTDRASMRQAMKRCDAVFHLAEYYDAGLQPKERAMMADINVAGARTVLSLAYNLGVPRIVYAGTATIFCGGSNGARRKPTPAAGKFTTSYQQTKWEAYQNVIRPLLERGAPIVTTLPGNVYGPGDTSIVGRLMSSYVKRRLPILLAGDALIPWVHIDDVVQGHLLAADKGKPGQQYLLVDKCLTMKETLKLFQELTGIPGPKVVSGPKTVQLATASLERLLPLPILMITEAVKSMPDVTCVVTADKTRRELGWTTRPLEEGFKHTLDSFLEPGNS